LGVGERGVVGRGAGQHGSVVGAPARSHGRVPRRVHRASFGAHELASNHRLDRPRSRVRRDDPDGVHELTEPHAFIYTDNTTNCRPSEA